MVPDHPLFIRSAVHIVGARGTPNECQVAWSNRSNWGGGWPRKEEILREREREGKSGALAQRKQGGQPGRPRRPIKDADGSELFKLQVWWFLCISCNVDDDDDEDDEDAIAAGAGVGTAAAVAVAVASCQLRRQTVCVCGSNRWNVHVALGIRTWRTLAPVLVMHWNLISLLALLVAIVQ